MGLGEDHPLGGQAVDLGLQPGQGGGLAGALLALELSQRGSAVTLLDAAEADTATALSYGGIPGWPLLPTPLARRAAGAARRWRQLQRRHGDLGGPYAP